MAKKGDDGSAAIAAQARADEQARQQKIREGTERVNSIFDTNFNDDFFADREKSYIDYATPQYQEQYADAKKQLTYALDRSGLLGSSVRAEKEAELEKEADQIYRGIADSGRSYGNSARSDVESSRADLITMLNSTGDVEGAVSGALNRSNYLSASPNYTPLTRLFDNFTSALGTQAAAERAQYYSNGMVKAPVNTGLFSSSGSVKVT